MQPIYSSIFVGKSHYWIENQQSVKTLAATKGPKSM